MFSSGNSPSPELSLGVFFPKPANATTAITAGIRTQQAMGMIVAKPHMMSYRPDEIQLAYLWSSLGSNSWPLGPRSKKALHPVNQQTLGSKAPLTLTLNRQHDSGSTAPHRAPLACVRGFQVPPPRQHRQRQYQKWPGEYPQREGYG